MKLKVLADKLWYSLIIIIYGRRYCSFFGVYFDQITVSTQFQFTFKFYSTVIGINWRLRVVSSVRARPSRACPVPLSLVSICQKWTYLSVIRNRITVNLISLFTGLSAWLTANDHFDSFWTLFTQSSHHKNHKTLLKCWKS